ncbi:MAG: nicotinamide-nucleotide amidohydrolase family protein [Bacteriovoracaceae bacterium]|nr:nicotinamide-nucleotide amidohydrolase family protein [Bacteriovoracaceae bacterium]
MSQYKAKLIVIGDELLTGKIKDANTIEVARWLESQGFGLGQVILSGDSPDELFEVIKDALETADLVMTTGGLGPTPDDVTKAVLAKVFKGELCESQVAREMAIKNYERIGKEWSPEKNSYHLIPSTMNPIENPQGLAPGLSRISDKKLFMAAPGVPRELKAMMDSPFIELLNQVFSDRENNHQVLSLRTYGVPEEKIFFELMPQLWNELSKEGKVSSLPQVLGVDIHLSFSGTNNDLEEKKERWQQLLNNSPLGPHIWAYEAIAIENYIVREATRKSLTLSLAESCTGGLVAHRLTNVPGSAAVFMGSIVAYANEVKTNILGVQQETLRNFGAVSVETAREMAIGAQKVCQTNLAVSLSGIAGPGGGTPDKPVGTVCIGESNSTGEASARLYHFRGDREYLKLRFSEMALHRLRKGILKY